MKITWLEDAVYDLRELRCYIAKDNVIAANQVAQRILTSIEILSEQPEMGRGGRVPHTRELIVPGTPYIIPYKVKGNSIEILRVYHCAMEWPEEF